VLEILRPIYGNNPDCGSKSRHRRCNPEETLRRRIRCVILRAKPQRDQEKAALGGQ
jgi:hypothetical protein